MNYDIVIVSHEKDFHKLKFVVESIEENLDFSSIHIILSEREELKEKDIIVSKTTKNVVFHNETDILKIDKTRLKVRPNWMYQMMLKFFQDVTENDNYLVVESDIYINKKFNFFENGKTKFYISSDQYLKNYFNFNEKIIGCGKEFKNSFISEFMMYDKKIIKKLLEKCNCEKVDDFLELLYEHACQESYPADYELYGTFFYKYFNDNFCYENIKTMYNGKYIWQSLWNDEQIEHIIKNNKNDYDLITFHSWE